MVETESARWHLAIARVAGKSVEVAGPLFARNVWKAYHGQVNWAQQLMVVRGARRT